MKWKVTQNPSLRGDIPIGKFGSFDLSEGSENYIRNLGTAVLPDFLLNIFGKKPTPTPMPGIDKNVVYVVAGGAGLLMVILLLKKKPNRPRVVYRNRPKKKK